MLIGETPSPKSSPLLESREKKDQKRTGDDDDDFVCALAEAPRMKKGVGSKDEDAQRRL